MYFMWNPENKNKKGNRIRIQKSELHIPGKTNYFDSQLDFSKSGGGEFGIAYYKLTSPRVWI